MAWLVVLGAILMGSGAFLILLQRRSTADRRPAGAAVSVATLGRFDPVIEHIDQIDEVTARLEQAVDAVVPARGAEGPTPKREDVAAAYAAARERLLELARDHLRRPPSPVVVEFAALTADMVGSLDGSEDPNADELAELDAAVRRSGWATAAYVSAVERYADERRRRAVSTRRELMRQLQTAGHALRWDRRRMPSATGQLRVEVGEVVHELGQGVAGYVAALRPLTEAAGGGHGQALKRRERAELARRIVEAEMQMAKAEGLVARGAPLEALRTLSAVSVPDRAGRSADAALAMASGAAAAGLRVVAARRDAALGELVAHCAAAVDRHVAVLHDAVLADAEERRRVHRAAFEAVVAAAGLGEATDEPTAALPTRPIRTQEPPGGAPDAATVETRPSRWA